MARAANPKLMLLDEPASGLSRGERVALTDLLLELDRDITLILIEHDMDVALRVAERVTMMHDGRDRRGHARRRSAPTQLVHELYLGDGTRDDRHERDAAARRSSDLDAYYGTAHVSQAVIFEMGDESVAIIGRNGMGKTTLCNAIMQIRPPSARGSIRFDGTSSSAAVLPGRLPRASATSRRAGGFSPRSRSTST